MVNQISIFFLISPWVALINSSINSSLLRFNFFCAQLQSCKKSVILWYLGSNFLKPFAFILDNIDSISDEKPFLPILISENISHYYFSSEAKDSREVVKASQVYGINNESVMQLISGVNQKVNIYENYVKNFSSRFSILSITFPNIVYKPFKWFCLEYVIKNCELFNKHCIKDRKYFFTNHCITSFEDYKNFIYIPSEPIDIPRQRRISNQ